MSISARNVVELTKSNVKCAMEQAKKRMPKDAVSAIIRGKLNVIIATGQERITFNVLLVVGMARWVGLAMDTEIAQHAMAAAIGMVVGVNAVIPLAKSHTLR